MLRIGASVSFIVINWRFISNRSSACSFDANCPYNWSALSHKSKNNLKQEMQCIITVHIMWCCIPIYFLQAFNVFMGILSSFWIFEKHVCIFLNSLIDLKREIDDYKRRDIILFFSLTCAVMLPCSNSCSFTKSVFSLSNSMTRSLPFLSIASMATCQNIVNARGRVRK